MLYKGRQSQLKQPDTKADIIMGRIGMTLAFLTACYVLARCFVGYISQ